MILKMILIIRGIYVRIEVKENSYTKSKQKNINC